ncbi:hypothetical protein GCK72_001743 [Caenorhabditis remanei]|uniref:Uncharacterized protein n=1 Tax=Caenorhabditis remanei TaxID=31234 RepID=E3LN15_CAERE|nr:hypothetical protein GCK72_001743 [Caenorhabditis remanei]EFP02837.1 hypothetical protein CRE_28557 [Caenorhabditis remanei]KAF1769926.1 hypothetical protein GCK72_001743 [Caenorhabditis remanei]
MKCISVFLIALLAIGVFCSKHKMEGQTGMDSQTNTQTLDNQMDKVHRRLFRRQMPYGTYGNVQYGGSGISAGNGWNGGIVGSARGFGFGTGSDGYH